MTTNQFRQALRIYTADWNMLSFPLMWLGFQVLWFFAGREPRGDRAFSLVTMMLVPTVMNFLLGGIFGAILKIQFANPRSRLLPGFAMPHLLIAGAFIATTVAVQTALTPAWLGSGGQWGVFGLSVASLAVAMWTIALVNPIGIFLGMGLFFVSPFASDHLADVYQALFDCPPVSVGLACLGFASLALLARRLSVLSEDMPEYSWEPSVGWSAGTSRARRRQPHGDGETTPHDPTRYQLRNSRSWFIPGPGRATGPWRRLLLNQVTCRYVGVTTAVHVSAWNLAFLLIFGQHGMYANREFSVFLLSFIPMWGIISSLVVFGNLRPCPALELLRPLGRREFVADIARNMACNLALPGVAHCSVIVAALTLIFPQGPLSGLLLPWLALTAAQYLVAGCLLFWLASFRHLGASFLGMLGMCIVSTVLVYTALFAERGFWSPGRLVSAVVATGVVAVLMYRTAFRRWCRVDLG